MSDAEELRALCARMTEVLAAADKAFTAVAAHALTTRAPIELLHERGILFVDDLRERALAIARADDVSPEVSAAIERLLPDAVQDAASTSFPMMRH